MLNKLILDRKISVENKEKLVNLRINGEKKVLRDITVNSKLIKPKLLTVPESPKFHYKPRKKTVAASNCIQTNMNSFGTKLNTEQRAVKRQQFDQYLKDKERMQELVKKDLELQKANENKKEVQKLRSQMIIKSHPIKQFKPMEIKPSDKPLTDPKSPQLHHH